MQIDERSEPWHNAFVLNIRKSATRFKSDDRKRLTFREAAETHICAKIGEKGGNEEQSSNEERPMRERPEQEEGIEWSNRNDKPPRD
jgi:hypothetical protein